jgi:23S rRNA pseudouridine2605 synthase
MEKVEDQNSSVHKENIRLNRYLALCGVTSRRKAEELIRQGRVQINGRVVTELATTVDPLRDKVFVDSHKVQVAESFIYILLHKPKDYITTVSDERGRKTVMDLLPGIGRCYPVGRLDRNTTGVLLVTNDGELAHRLMHPRYKVAKSYLVKIDQPLDESDRKSLLRGVMLDGRPAGALDVVLLEHSRGREVGVTIREGRNRQVRRMFDVLGYTVKALERVEYAGITAKGLKRGEWRYLSKREIKTLKELVQLQ